MRNYKGLCSPYFVYSSQWPVRSSSHFTDANKAQRGRDLSTAPEPANIVKAGLALRSLGSESKGILRSQGSSNLCSSGRKTQAEALSCSPGKPCPATDASQPRGCWENPSQVQRPPPSPHSCSKKRAIYPGEHSPGIIAKRPNFGDNRRYKRLITLIKVSSVTDMLFPEAKWLRQQQPVCDPPRITARVCRAASPGLLV